MTIRKTYKFESSRTEVKNLEIILFELNKEFKISEDKIINFQIAASEAMINAIVHGNKENKDKHVFVELVFDNDVLTLTIKDEGVGFDINLLPDPTNEENLFKEHGRGIFIMSSLTDKFECIPSQNGTTYTLSINK